MTARALQHPIGQWLDKINVYLACIVAFSIPISAAVNNIAFYTLLGLFVLSGNWLEKWQVLKHSRLAQAALLLLALTYLSVSYSIASHLYAVTMASKYDKLLLIPVLLYTLKTERDRTWCLNSFWAALALTLVVGYIKFYYHLPTVLENWYWDKATPFITHIETNMMMAIFAFWMVYHCLKANTTRQARLMWGVLAVITIHYVLAMSPGRSGYLVFAALMAYLFYFFIVRKHWRQTIIIAAVTLIGFGLAFTSPQFQSRMEQAQSNVQQYTKGNPATSIGDRMSFYHHTAFIIEHHWLIGTGIGGFEIAYQQLVNQLHLIDHTSNPHDQYLDTTAQLGIIGLALLLWLYFNTWHERNRENEWQIILAQGMCVGMIAGSLFNSWLMDLHAGFCFCLLASIGTWRKHAL